MTHKLYIFIALKPDRILKAFLLWNLCKYGNALFGVTPPRDGGMKSRDDGWMKWRQNEFGVGALQSKVTETAGNWLLLQPFVW